MEDKYRVCLSYTISKCTGGEDHSSDELMAEGEGAWQGLSYEDLCQFEAVMLSQITHGLTQLGLKELEKKKSGKK